MKAIILLCLLIVAWSQSGSINVKPVDPTLFASTSYTVSFYTFNSMSSTSAINLNFTATYITVPNGALNVTATINGTAVSGGAPPSANCTNSICTLRMNRGISAGQGTTIAFVIGNLVNPFFQRSQSITSNVTFNSSYFENPSWVIPQNQYTPMAIVSNYFNQSDYGVGNTDVSYFFSFQLPISPPSVQLSLTLPPQVGVGSLQVSLTYYGSPQVFNSVYVNNIFLFSFNPTASNTSGTLILNVSGLTNPQSIGSSGSFVLQMLVPNLPGTAASCTGCVVASINNGLFAQSKVPGKVQTMNIQSTNRTIGRTNTISIFTKVNAAIPSGGMYKIILPSSIKPILPVNCFSSYGFTMINNGAPSCSYDSSTNSINTNNFIFAGSGDALIGVTIKNSPDTTPANFFFQTFDSAGNMIGNSSKGYFLTATPLQLAVSANKTNSQVDSTFKITVNCTLAVELTSSNLIRVTFPQASYNTASIACSSGTTIACNSTIDQTSGILIVTLRPPCTQCKPGTNFLFAIDGLMNPSFINSDTQQVIIDTATQTGTIQSARLSLSLTEATLSISNYNRSGANAIGASYSMSFTYTIPVYITTNGGLLLINFNQFDTYVNPVYDTPSATYSFPTSLTITDTQGKTYTNSIVYYSDVDPPSIKQIAIDICGQNSCGTSLIISGIRKGFSPLSSMTQNMQITTVFGESVSTYSFNIISYNVARSSKSLGISLSNSVTTLNSNYVFTFTSQNIPFQNGLTFSLSSMHNINGGCVIAQASVIFNGVFNCKVVNTTSISITYNGDINQMLLDSIQYTLTIINITNPVSVAPLSYSISTQYNNQVNQQFTVSYSILTPLPLSFIYSKANNTFGQSTTLNISIVSNYPTFSQIKLTAPSSLISIFSLPSSSYATSMVNNAYQISQIYSLSSGSFSLNIINPNSTNITGNVTVQMYSQGYLAATGNLVIQAVAPLYLGLSATSSNRIVGGSTNLTVRFDRVNSYSSEAQFLLNITNSLFDCTFAKYNNAPITFPLAVPIGLTSITITNVTNLLFIPQNNPSDGIKAWTIDDSSYTVAISSIIPTNLVPNAASTGLSWAFTRTNTAINGVGAVNIMYTPRFPTSVGIMKVVMPANQTTITSPSCSMQGSSNNANTCSVLSSSTSTITLNFFNQTTTSLTNVINLQPNSNLLQLYLYTINNELVQSVNGSITPNIQFNELAIAGNISSNVVATNNQINMNITSPNPIDIGSKLVFSFPSNTFTRISNLVTQDCTYSINGNNYNGCQYGMINQWVNILNITYLGPVVLPINTSIQVSIYFTNAWSVTPFSSSSITVHVSSPTDNYVSQGVLPLISLFGALNSLQPASLSNVTLTQTSSLAGKDNIATISFTSNVPLPVGANIIVSLPKSAYTLVHVTTVTNLKSNSQNTTHYLLTLGISCTQTSPLCTLSNNQFSTTVNFKNNPYVQLIQSQFSVQLLLSNNVVSSQSLIKIPSITPQTIPSVTISRSNINAFANTNISIATTNPTGINAFTVIISPISTTTAVLPLLRAPSSVLLNTISSLSYSMNSSSHMLINVVGATGPSSTITVLGQNNLLIPTTTQKYTVTIMDSLVIYFTADVILADTLIPYGQGLNLQRIITTVSTSTNVYLYGTLPIAIPSLNVLFNSVNYTVSGSNFNISLGSITNSMNLSDSTPYSITLRNNDVVAFKSNLQMLPALTPQNLSALSTLTIPSQVNINSNFDIKLELTATTMTYLSLKTAPFFNSLTKCCVDPQCLNPVTSCKLTQTSSNNLIQISLPSSQQVTFITFTVTSLQFQKVFTNEEVVISSALPSSTVTLKSSIAISATNLSTSLSLKNWKVNNITTYNVYITPIAKEGFMRISLPSFISSQLDERSYHGCTMIVNGTQKPTTLGKSISLATIVTQISVTTPNISLVIASIQNPMDNFPYSILIQQSLDADFSKIHGVSTLPIVMKQFDSIVISSAVRTVTKVNVQTVIDLQINSPYSTNQLILNFPTSQLVTGTSCSIFISEDITAPCTIINTTAIFTNSYEGITKYTITGLKNQNFYDSHTAGDVIQAQIGKKYTRALTSLDSSSAITPRLTLGTITLNSFASSSQTMLQSSTLTYNITIQNTNNIDGFVIEYSEYHYLFSNKTTAKVNGQQVPCKAMTNHSIFVAYPNPSQNNLLVSVLLAYNFIKPSAWSFKSVRSSPINGVNTYSDVDLYYNNGETLTSLQPSSIKFRVILPNNYVQTTPVEFLAVIDTKYQFSIPTSVFNFNFTTQSSSCSIASLTFSSTLILKCTFSQATTYNMKLQMYHATFPSMPISAGQVKVNIYPQPTDSCQNNMCDLCSQQNGKEYCFKCREGMFSANGQCESNCPSGSFPYLQTKICQQCSPTCTTCFNLYADNCLSCQNKTLALNSGKCQETCPSGSLTYRGYCTDGQQCQSADGCRICSTTGFCYECLPDYSGEPNCQYQNAMPPTLMIYVLIPFLIAGIIPLIIAAFKCVGADSMLSQAIFSFSFIELFAWACTVPIAPTIIASMALISFLTIRVIISIVSYQVFYKKNMGQLSQKLLEEQSQKQNEKSQKKEQQQKNDLDNWKTKLVRFFAHFNGPDSYELLKCKISEPVLSVNNSLAAQVLFMANRWVACFLMVYLLSVSKIGDSVLMPLIVIASAALITLCRLLTVDKVRKCLTCFRT